MANDTIITIIGNLTATPELRFLPNGAAVANFTIASTPRAFDKQANDWKEGETLFMRCSVWRDAAENVTETLQTGMRVIAQGRLKSRSFDTKEGDRRTVMELDVDEIGPSLRFASATVQRQSSGGGNSGRQQGGQQRQQPQGDPWGQQSQIDSSGWDNGSSGAYDGNVPF